MTNGAQGDIELSGALGPSAPAATVCFIWRNDKVLLQERPPGRVWAGRLNGPGGKVAAGETPGAAIVREVAEETRLHIADPLCHGVLELVFGVPERSRLAVFLFSCERFTGRARGGREGKLRWYPDDRLPFDRLWPDMRYWLPTVLDGGTVNGVCAFDKDGRRLLSCSLHLRWKLA